MAKVLTGLNGKLKMVDSIDVTIFDETITVVSGTPSGDKEIQGPVSAGASITLPDSKTYEGQELEIWLNNIRLEDVLDYNFEGTIPRTQFSLTFDLVVGDKIRLRIDRGA